MKTSLIILKNSVGGFPQLLDEVESILTPHFYSALNTNDFKVVEALYVQYKELVVPLLEIEDNKVFIFYCSSQHPSYYNYIFDIMMDAQNRGAILIPSLDHLKSHENKFYQELYKARLAIPTPKSWLLGSIEDIAYLVRNGLDFPVIAKLPQGFGSKTVSKINSHEELLDYCRSHLTPTVKPRKNIFKYKESLKKYKDKYPASTGSIVLQEFIPQQTHDWKVLVIGNKVFSLKRYTRDNDFRASGSGNFSGDKVPSLDLVNFAYNVKQKLKTPWVSMDIIESPRGYLIIEYQCIHFGPYTVTSSKQHHLLEDNSWRLVKAPAVYEEELATALISTIRSDS